MPHLRDRSIHGFSLINFYKRAACSSNLYEFSQRGAPFLSIFPHRVRRPRLRRGRPKKYTAVAACCGASSVALDVWKVLFCSTQGQSAVSMSPSKRVPNALPEQNERLDEENRVRLKEETRQAKLREKRREEAKNNIILQVCRLF